jgi:hypothetical protein
MLFKTLLGVPQSNFNDLFQEVPPPPNQQHCQENYEAIFNDSSSKKEVAKLPGHHAHFKIEW